MERTTRLVVVIAAVALLAGHLAIGRAWSGMPAAAAAVLLGGALSSLRSANAVAPVMAVSCLLPPVVWFTLGTFATQYWIVWLAALLGVMLPRTLTTPWQSPPRWRAPLLLAALAVVVGTPIVALRELDFNPALLHGAPAAVLSGLPWFSVEWVLQVAVAALVGILWFDWLVGQPALAIDRAVIAPLTLSIAVSAVMALYQMFGDITFVNETAYGAIGRAGGTMFDANVGGMLAAMAVGMAGYLASGEPRRPAWLWVVPVCVLAVWASGSRTAFAALAIIVAVGAVSWRRGSGASPVLRRRAAVFSLAVAAVAVVALGGASLNTTTVGPLQRFVQMLPGAGGPSPGAAIAELWNRNGYGAAATYLIERYPWSGIGIGGFHLFGPPLTPIGTLPPDNAQNWLRHQVVEMGVLGAGGWIVFTLTFAYFLVTSWRRFDPRVIHLRGVVLAVGLISLVGMPTQEVVPAMAFWAAAAVLVRHDQGSTPWTPLRRSHLTMIIVVTVAFGMVTWSLATTRLRVPVRARQLGWPYAYGLYAPEPDGAGGTVRWMADRATALVDAEGRYMRISIRSPLPNLAADPVGVKVWAEGKLALDTRLATGDPVTTTVAVPAGLTKVLLDLRVTRTVRPRDLDGSADDRQLGALVSWTFSAAP